MKQARRVFRIYAALLFAVLLSQCSFSAFGQSPNASSSGESSSSKPAAPVPDEKGIYKVGGPVSAPKLIHYVDPKYSGEARRAKFSGSCVVALIVDTEGKPRDIHIIQSVGKGLDENAIKAIQQYRFKPAMYNGKPVPVEIKVEARFSIYN